MLYVIFSFLEKHEPIERSAKSTGTARPSFVANALAEIGTDDESNEDVYAVKSVAGGIFSGEQYQASILPLA